MRRPNIALITIDSLRADHVFGDAAATPTIDAIANEGIAYTNAFAQGPFTTFSMPSLFSSRYPSSLSYVSFSENTVGVAIEDEPTVSTLLSNAGYETAGFHSNPLLSNLFGFDRGFDLFEANLPFSDTHLLPGRVKILADKLARAARKNAYIPAEKLTGRALDWLDDRDPERPFFLWLHYMDVHGPYQSKSGFSYLDKYRGERLWRKAVKDPESVTRRERNRLQELYREEIEYTDRWIDTLTDGLHGRGLSDETLVAITADHGEEFFEHGRYSHPHELYDELIHVPLVFSGPNLPTTSRERMIELTDLAPTLVDVAGGEIPQGMTGTSLDTDTPKEKVISEANLHPAYTGCVRTERWKYIYDGMTDRQSLFDLDSDPAEETDVKDRYPSVLERLSSDLEEHVDSSRRSIGSDGQGDSIELDAATRSRLEDLGYF